MDENKPMDPHAETNQDVEQGTTTELKIPDDPSPPPDYEQATAQVNQPPEYESLYGRIKAAKDENSGSLGFFKFLTFIILAITGCGLMIAFTFGIPISMIVMGSMYKSSCNKESMIPTYLIVGGSFGLISNILDMCRKHRQKKSKSENGSECESKCKSKCLSKWLKSKCENKCESKGEIEPENKPESKCESKCKSKCWTKCDKKCGSKCGKKCNKSCFECIINLFLFIWFICGNVWIYRTYGNFSTEDADAADYCHPTLYWYAFWLTTAMYIMMGAACVCACCCGLVFILCCLAAKCGNSSAKCSMSEHFAKCGSDSSKCGDKKCDGFAKCFFESFFGKCGSEKGGSKCAMSSMFAKCEQDKGCKDTQNCCKDPQNCCNGDRKCAMSSFFKKESPNAVMNLQDEVKTTQKW